MVVRDRGGSIEVLMLRRSLASQFVSGVYVFPGGAVDPGDADPEMLSRCVGRSDGESSTLLGLDSGGLRYWVSASRECFEEAGVLVATGPDGRPLTFEDPEAAGRFVEHRRALNAGRCSFLDICRAEGLTLPASETFYVGHWITPEGPPRRYDTRFFVTRAPAGQTAVHDEIETIDHMWIAPTDALARHEDDRIDLVLPTIWNLRLLTAYRTTDELFDELSAAGAAPMVRPVLIEDERGPRMIASIDPGARGQKGVPS
jgi:8-oxo-dGTP pyrophosphatase MutT (NUDIX family)